MSTITELREKQSQIVSEARTALEEITSATPEARATELNEQHDRAMQEYDRIEERIGRLEKIANAEAALNEADSRRPSGENRTVTNEVERPEAERYADAFRSFVRGGRSSLTAEQRAVLGAREQRAQSVGTPAAGGYLVPDQFYAELIKSLKAWGPMFDPGVTRILNTATGATITFPTMDDTSNVGALIAENTQVTLSEVEFGTRSLGAYKYTSGVTLVSDELLQDSVLDIEAIVRDAQAERIGRIGNRHLTIGTGTNQPQGIVTAATAVAAAAAAAITFDDLIELEHSVDPAYRSDPSCAWQFNDATLKALRKIKDGEGRYIWQPADVKAGAPSTILNYRFAVNQDVPSIGAENRSVIFGAMNKYVVRLVKEFAIKRLVERYADYGQVGFIGFTRFDGDLLDTAAVKALTHPE